MTTTVSAIDLPFEEAIDFLRAKTNVTSQSYLDVLGRANAKSFTVAGATTQALVSDFRREVAKAIETGTSLQEFRKGFDGIVKRHGWEHTGKPGWRSRVIYETNLSMAYAAGRYKQQTEPETLAAYPYWQYVHSGALHPRLQHKSWNGITLRADDAWWDTHYPPNGWHCGCRIRPLSARGLQRLGKSGPDAAPPINMVPHLNRKTGRTMMVPEGIDPGFDYNVGQEWAGLAKMPANATLTAPVSAPAPGASPRPPAAPAARTPAHPDEGLVTVVPAEPAAPGISLPPVPAAKSKPLAVVPKPTVPQPEPEPIRAHSRADVDRADKILTKDFEHWGRQLSARESVALELYKGSGYEGMNRLLRGQGASRLYKPHIRALDEALSRAKTKRAMVLHRGVPAGTIWDTVKVGDRIADKGFLSSSVTPTIAEKFGTAVHIEIRLPKGYTGGAYVNRIPRLQLEEYEFIFRPGSPFRVVERSEGKIVVEPIRGGRRRAPELD